MSFKSLTRFTYSFLFLDNIKDLFILIRFFTTKMHVDNDDIYRNRVVVRKEKINEVILELGSRYWLWKNDDVRKMKCTNWNYGKLGNVHVG